MIAVLQRLTAIALGLSLTSLFAQEISYPPSVAVHQARLPQAVQYAIVLHQAAAFKDLADTLNGQGKDGDAYQRHLRHKFALTPQQVNSLELVAVQYREDVKQANQRLEASILRFHEQVEQLPGGATIPPPPSEALLLIAERDAVTLSALDRFRVLVGDEDFAKIDTAFTALERPSPGAKPVHRAAGKPGEAGAFGYTSMFFDPTTKVVTAYAETALYGPATYYYGAGLTLSSSDRSVEGAAQPGGFAVATFAFADPEGPPGGPNHFVKGTHTALLLAQAQSLKWNDYYGLQRWAKFDVLAADAFTFTALEPDSNNSNQPCPLGATFQNGW